MFCHILPRCIPIVRISIRWKGEIGKEGASSLIYPRRFPAYDIGNAITEFIPALRSLLFSSVMAVELSLIFVSMIIWRLDKRLCQSGIVSAENMSGRVSDK